MPGAIDAIHYPKSLINKKGLLIKLKTLAEEFKILENKKDYETLMDTIQIIEEIIYLNKFLLEDLHRYVKLIEEKVPTMQFLLDEEL